MNSKTSNLGLILVVFLLVGIFSTASAHNNKPTSLSLASDTLVNKSEQVFKLNQELQSAFYRADSPEKELSSERLQSVIKIREALLAELAAENPAAFFAGLLPQTEKAKLPKAIQSTLEREVVVLGVLRAIHIDDFTNHDNSSTKYFLETDNKNYDLYSVKSLDKFFVGSTIEVSGVSLANFVVARNLSLIDSADQLIASESTGEQRVAVLLIDFADSVSQRPFSAKEAQGIIFDSQFQKFFAEQSYNKVSFAGDVYGWYTLPRSVTNYSVCGGAVTQEEVENIIAQNNINLHKYDRLLVMPSHPYVTNGCSSVGKYNQIINGESYYISTSWIGNLVQYNWPSFWGAQPFSWTNLDYLLAHELGHALGVQHANGLDCHNEIVYGNACRAIEYGNAFDTMGNLSYSLHFNAFNKERLGWITKDNSTTVSQDVKGLIIDPLAVGKGKVLVKILQSNQSSRTKKSPYYLEYRKAVGFDSNLKRRDFSSNQQGIFINKIPSFSVAPQLLDMTPRDAADWYSGIRNTTLNKGQTFTDLGRGISISVLGSTSTASSTISDPIMAISRDTRPTVAISYFAPECERFVPRVNQAYAPNFQIPAGDYGFISMRFENADYYGCGAANFVIETILPPGWSVSQTYPENNLTRLEPEEESYASTNFYIPVGTTPGAYFVEMKVRNTASGLVSSFPTNIFVTN